MPWDLQYRVQRRTWVLSTGCWLWMGGLSSDGYGRTRLRNKGIGAHQLSYLAFTGDIPDGAQIMHSCDNRWCVNPDHLSAGTVSENNYSVWRRGGRTPKLSPAIAEHIRLSPESNTALASQFGVNQSTISRIRSGYRYAVGTSERTG